MNEAEAWDKPLTEGVALAKNYAGKLDLRWALATNGQGIYRVDISLYETAEQSSWGR
jgi:type I restriction enzyme R subunit